MNKNILERMVEISPGMEIWWDSSPLVYPTWKQKLADDASPREEDFLKKYFEHFFNPTNPESQVFRGVTTNPILSLEAMNSNKEYWREVVRGIVKREPQLDDDSLFWLTYKEVIKRGSDIYISLFEKSNYTQGFLSAQLDIRDIDNVDHMMAKALELTSINPNIMVKVPGSKAGYEVIKKLTSKGIATNNTLTFVASQLMDCAYAVKEGLVIARKNGVDLSRWRSVITHMEGRFGELGELKEEALKVHVELSDGDIRLAELAIFKKVYKKLKAEEFESKLLSCSLKLGPKIDGEVCLWHLEHIVGADVVVTCPPKFIKALLLEPINFSENNHIGHEIPQEVITKLMKVEYFKRAYSEDGFSKEEYSELIAFKKTKEEHLKATEEMLFFVKQSRNHKE